MSSNASGGGSPGKVTIDRIKKENNIRYHKTWNTGLSNLMGVYSLFFANSKQYKALTVFNRTLSYIQDDVQYRMFTKADETGERVVDIEAIVAFDELAREFRLLFGSEPVWVYERTIKGRTIVTKLDENRPFSYRDLMVPSPPDPTEDRVYIQRDVPLIYSWGNRPATYVALKIGFLYTITEHVQTPYGVFPIQKQIPMFDWNSPDVISGQTKSNCVPYTYYQEQKVRLINLLMVVVSQLEAIIARYLHQEGFNGFNAQERIGSTDDDSWVEDDTSSDDFSDMGATDDEESEGANED